MRSAPLLATLLVLASCSSPPKPPTVDESKRHPVNPAIAVELQNCSSELQNTKILVAERSRDAEASRAALARLAALRQPKPAPAEVTRSVIYTVLFPFGGTTVSLTPSRAERLLREASAAPLIVLSGRTDGTNEALSESRIARERAEAVRAYLIAAGVASARIRTTWQPIGDPAADNSSVDGRTLNRRVEVEIYRLAPRLASLDDDGSAEKRGGM